MTPQFYSTNGPSVIRRVLLAAIVCCFGGCSTITQLGDQSVPVVAGNANARDTFRVEMNGAFNKTTAQTFPLDGNTTVQTALEMSGAIKKFRDMDIMVYRIVEETGRPLKMFVDYVPRKNAVTPEQDYAIRPGDRVIVRAASNSLLDKVVETVGSN